MKHKVNVYGDCIAVLVAVIMVCLTMGCDRDNRESSKGAGAFPIGTKPLTKPSASQISLAGEIRLKNNVDNLDNALVTCQIVRPLRAGDIVAAYTSPDSAISVDYQTVEANGRSANYPLFAMMKDSNGVVGSVLLADVRLKVDVTSRNLVDRDGCRVFAMRDLRAGQALKVLYNPDLGAASIERETVNGTITPVLLITIGSDPNQHKARQLVSLWAAADSIAGR